MQLAVDLPLRAQIPIKGVTEQIRTFLAHSTMEICQNQTKCATSSNEGALRSEWLGQRGRV